MAMVEIEALEHMFKLSLMPPILRMRGTGKNAASLSESGDPVVVIGDTEFQFEAVIVALANKENLHANRATHSEYVAALEMINTMRNRYDFY